jgi:hypothetical protein
VHTGWSGIELAVDVGDFRVSLHLEILNQRAAYSITRLAREIREVES